MDKIPILEIKQLDTIAKKGSEIPKNMTHSEYSYVLNALMLYKMYENNLMSLDDCRKEKENAIKRYVDSREMENFLNSVYKIKDKLRELKEQGFNTVIEFEILEEIEKITR